MLNWPALPYLFAASWPIQPVLDAALPVDVRDPLFWFQRFLLIRNLVLYALPFASLLFFVPLRWRREAIVVTGLLFLGYVFGALHALLYLVFCVAFFHLAERFAYESKRTDVWRGGPPVAAISVISLWYFLSQKLSDVRLPASIESWLHAHLPWLYPIGLRGFPWEPLWLPPDRTPSIFAAYDEHYPLAAGAHLIGTAYLAIRMLHYFSEIRRDGICPERRNLRDFLGWLFYAPSLMQGPIERFAPFHNQLAKWNAQRSPAELLYGVWRIALGVSKSLAAHVFLLPLVLSCFTPTTLQGASVPFYHRPDLVENYWFLYFGVAIHFMWLYLEFSGYCDIAIGISRCLGYKLAENFNWVWISRSLREFWRRWHMTLSFILRDYVYIQFGGNRAPLRNLVLTFVICGIWHKWFPPMWQWGIIMGVMVWLNQRWVEFVQRLDQASTPLPSGTPAVQPPQLSTFERACAVVRRVWLRMKPLPQLFAWLLTMHAFFASIIVFFAGIDALQRIGCELIARPLSHLVGA